MNMNVHGVFFLSVADVVATATALAVLGGRIEGNPVTLISPAFLSLSEWKW